MKSWLIRNQLAWRDVLPPAKADKQLDKPPLPRLPKSLTKKMEEAFQQELKKGTKWERKDGEEERVAFSRYVDARRLVKNRAVDEARDIWRAMDWKRYTAAEAFFMKLCNSDPLNTDLY